MPALLTVNNLSKSYPIGAGGRLHVLDDISFDVNTGEVVAVVGESGTGKTTLLHLLGALDRPDQGAVLFRGDNIFRKSNEELARFRNQNIGFVFQFHHLLPEFTAVENVAMPALIANQKIAVASKRATELLDLLGIAGRAQHRPSALSGGEQQRVAVARALMNSPDLVLGDEPTGNLDTQTADRLHEEIVRLSRMMQRTFVIVTHNLALASMADRIFTIRDRRLQESTKG